jgi:VPDSG-CTERM motif
MCFRSFKFKPNMKAPKLIASTTLAIAGLSFSSYASLIDLGLISPLPSNPIGSEQAEADFLEDYLNLSYELDPTVLARINFPEPTPPSTQISWNLTGTGDQLNYVLLKDGSGTVNDVTGQLYRLYQVSDDQKFASGGLQTVMIDQDSNGTPDKGISHITFFGSPGASVPDGGATAMLLGIALASLGAFRRRLA